jgi:hypothetical protein
LYDFTGNDKNTTVQKVEDMVKEAWVRDFHPFPEIISCLFLQFADAIKDEPDVFLLAGHMPVARDNCEFIYSSFQSIFFFLLTLTQQGRLSSCHSRVTPSDADTDPRRSVPELIPPSGC